MSRGSQSCKRDPISRSETMRRVKSTDTTLELKLRKQLWAEGLRYRVRNKLTGRPDIVFVSQRLAIFVDSCFWHGCPEHCRIPSSNRDYWVPKIQRNRERDLRV